MLICMVILRKFRVIIRVSRCSSMFVGVLF